jgi:hypothetical protein
MHVIVFTNNLPVLGFHKSLLQKAGIACVIEETEPLGGTSFLNLPQLALKIVHEHDETAARQILAQHETEIRRFRPDWICIHCTEINSGAVEICFSCHSLHPNISPISIYEWLDRIRKKPGLYLGESSITRLEAFLVGLRIGVEQATRQTLRDDHHFSGFREWVVQKLGHASSGAGWQDMILEKNASEKDALERFFTLLDEYRSQRQ